MTKKAETFTNQLQIKDVIRKVQQELIESQKEREESGILPLFEVDSLELEINFIVRQQSEGRAGLSFAVVDAEAEHNYSREQVQKMTLRLKRAETDSYDFSPPFRRLFLYDTKRIRLGEYDFLSSSVFCLPSNFPPGIFIGI